MFCAPNADPNLMARSRCALFALNISHKKDATGNSSIDRSPKTRFPIVKTIIEKFKFFVISGDRKCRCCFFFFFFFCFFFFFWGGGGGGKNALPFVYICQDVLK